MRESRPRFRLITPKACAVILVCMGIPVLMQLSLLQSVVLPISDVDMLSASIADTIAEWEARVISSASSLSHGTITPFLPLDYKSSRQDLLDGLPDWVVNYVDWHGEQRAAFPGDLLFTDPNAPKLLIRTCYHLCGGLHDRLGKLPWDLYLANQTDRLLLLHWCHPVPLDEFLVPNLLDWTVPASQAEYHNITTCGGMEQKIKPLFDRQSHENRPRPDFWSQHLDAGLQRAVATNGDYKSTKILRHRILGDEAEFQKRLELAGETSDFIDWTPSFGKIFWLFFRPSAGVEKELDKVLAEQNLVPGQYSAVHCRVRHPKATKKFSKGKTPVSGGADRAGLLWQGEGRDFAVETSVHALQCGQTLLLQPDEPTYFYSDSEDLVHYMTTDLYNPTFLASNASLFESSKVHAAARTVVQRSRIVGRGDETENLHIDRQGGAEAAAYYGSFVDLLVGARSRCVTFGVGNYALFASKISGSDCRLQHQEESWGVDETKKQRTKACALGNTSLLQL